ncbi:Flavonoid 3-monooxygenase [Striga hermonthica]|uniref:Flavonoid 3-monooxygenase n=1 Tax=Striga hermonthica TaxID=68872 RepID=A0A9N7MFI4_STRHE|nr:Flavonoid 3-monooxygenase [Striga hermonthica]
MAWFWAVTSVLLFLWFLHQKLRGWKTKKKLAPGPVGLPILGHLHLLGKNLHRDLHHLSLKHGPIMSLRLGLVPAVVVSSPAGAELILKAHDLVFAGRPNHQAARHLSYGRKNILFAPYGPYWRNMRRLAALHLLSSQRIDEFRDVRRSELGNLVGSLRRTAGRREPVDLSARVSGLSGDLTCLMVFGRKYEDGDLDEKGFKAVIEETLQVAALPNLGDFFPFMGAVDLQGLTRRMKELSRVFDGFLERIIDDHVASKGEGKEAGDFVDTMMAILESGEAEFEFDRCHVKAVLLDMLVGGTDTSAATIEWILSELIRHPECMKQLQREIEHVVSMDHQVEESHLDRLEYLNSVVKETLRLHPVVPLLIHEPTEDCMLNDYHVPKGSRTIVNLWSIGRDNNVWHDPERFIPERFIEKRVDLKGKDFELIPFGSGRRGCPGLQLGLTVVRLVVAQLVHCFDWELPGCVSGVDLDMTEHFGMVTDREKHLVAIPTWRLNVELEFVRFVVYY